MWQIANMLSERAPVTQPSDIKWNPKETIKVVSLRSKMNLIDLNEDREGRTRG